MQSKIKAEYPYDDYYIYIVNHKKEGRKYAVLYPINQKTHERTTVSYARYLMSVKEKRILSENEQVDHIDEDRTNDSLENLQILTREENLEKNNKTRSKTLVLLKCPCCNRLFIREKRQTHLVKPQLFTSCSRHCAGAFSVAMKYKPDDEVVNKQIKDNVIEIFQEKDANIILDKYKNDLSIL